MAYQRKKRLSIEEYIQGVISADKITLSRAITLFESNLDDDKILAEKILSEIIPYAGKSLRIGITGVPGVGKSTFIESFGKFLTALGKRIAILAIDPSSQKSKGSILGDKTRMEALAHDPLAYIRPSSTGSALGGVGSKTREVMLLCEAAGFDIIIIETVGVGQSETTVKGMVDFFLLLMLAGAGDELQGMKKGIMETADAIVINKADGENKLASKKAKTEYQNALHLFPASDSGWQPKVTTCSAIEKEGIKEIWELIKYFETLTKKNEYFHTNRRNQNLHWMQEVIKYELENLFLRHPQVTSKLPDLEKKVLKGELPAINAAKELLSIYKGEA
jgi:LAO/AO transport system kinase